MFLVSGQSVLGVMLLGWSGLRPGESEVKRVEGLHGEQGVLRPVGLLAAGGSLRCARLARRRRR